MRAVLIFLGGITIFICAFMAAKRLYLRQNDDRIMSLWTVSPDKHLSMATSEFKEVAVIQDIEHKMRLKKATLKQIDLAIESINKVKGNTSHKIVVLLDESLSELQGVKKDIESGSEDVATLELAAARALNTLALAHLELSVKIDHSGETKSTLKSIRMALDHVQNALAISSDKEQIGREKIIIAELGLLLDSLEESGHFYNEIYTISVHDLSALVRGQQNIVSN